MNISTSCTNYCIASACDQGHGKEPGRKQRELCFWLAEGCTGIQRLFFVLSLILSFIMELRQISLLLFLIVRVSGLNKPRNAWAMNINYISNHTIECLRIKRLFWLRQQPRNYRECISNNIAFIFSFSWVFIRIMVSILLTWLETITAHLATPKKYAAYCNPSHLLSHIHQTRI